MLLETEYRQLRASVAWSDWTEPAAHRFGAVKAELARAGKRVDDFDVATASIALALGASVATCNRGHFQVIEGLDIEDWAPRGEQRGG